MAFINFDSGEPFGLPRGTVRGIIALAFTATIIYSFVTSGNVSTELVALAAPYLGFYFGTRASDPPVVTVEPLGPPAVGEPV